MGYSTVHEERLETVSCDVKIRLLRIFSVPPVFLLVSVATNIDNTSLVNKTMFVPQGMPKVLRNHEKLERAECSQFAFSRH